MFPDRVDLSTELGFAIVGGIALAFATPGLVRRHVTGQLTSMVDGVRDVAGFCTSRLRQLTVRS